MILSCDWLVAPAIYGHSHCVHHYDGFGYSLTTVASLLQQKSCVFTGCGHCQNAKPKFLKASEAFVEEPNKAFTAVDCTQDGGKLIS